MSYLQGEYKIDVEGYIYKRDLGLSYRVVYEKNGESYSSVTMVDPNSIPDQIPYFDYATVDLEVDDDPLQSSVSDCCGKVSTLNKNVVALTGATVAGSRQIANEKIYSAQVISDSLSKGFSRYIGYLIQEKKTELEAVVPSLFATVSALRDRLLERKDDLRSDYERITSRYSKIIQTLNDTLKQRLLVLDQQAFDIHENINRNVFLEPLNFSTGQTVCSGSEQLQAADNVQVCKLKNSSRKCMIHLRNYVKSIRATGHSIKNVMQDNVLGQMRRYAMPVVVMNSVSLNAAANICVLHCPQPFEKHFSPEIREAIRNKVVSGEEKSSDEISRIDKYFQKYIAEWVKNNPGVDQKAVDIIREMWQNNKKCLKN